MDKNQEFGPRLRELRVQRGLTQRQLADGVGVSPNYVAMLERGEKRCPSRPLVMALCQLLRLGRETAVQFVDAAGYQTQEDEYFDDFLGTVYRAVAEVVAQDSQADHSSKSITPLANLLNASINPGASLTSASLLRPPTLTRSSYALKGDSNTRPSRRARDKSSDDLHGLTACLVNIITQIATAPLTLSQRLAIAQHVSAFTQWTIECHTQSDREAHSRRSAETRSSRRKSTK